MAKDEAYYQAEKKIKEALKSGATELDLSNRLTSLDIVKIKELPDSIGQLQNLQKLNLSYNRLTTLPDSMGNLTKLRELNLDNNQLKVLPESLKQLMELQSLNLNDNQLTALPEFLGQLIKLQQLYLSNNKLTALPEWLRQLTRLQRLNLSSNQLKNLPEALGQLIQLKWLNFSNNQIAEIPKSIENLSQLSNLYLGVNDGGNPLKELPMLLRELRNLELLSAQKCHLNSIPNWLEKLTKLRKIYFDNNNITDIPSSLAHLEYLEILDLPHNPLNPELAEAYIQGLESVQAYLRAKAETQLILNEAKEGPRLFSFFPVDRSKFNPKTWIREKFRLVLWCEHSRLPLPVLNNGDMKKGVYDLELEREWFKKASPYLKFLTGTLGMVLPVASSAVKLALDETAYKLIEEQLDFGKSIIDATLGETAKISEFLGTADSTSLEHGVAIRGDGSALRELHALLKAKDPGFGGLIRVMNKRQEFLWVHEKFASEY